MLSDKIKKYVKCCNINYKISILIFIPIIILFLCGIFINKINPEEYVLLEDAIQKFFMGEEIKNKPTYINATKIFDSFAVYEENGVPVEYYTVAQDEDNFMYLVSFKAAEYRKLEDFIENSVSDNPKDMGIIELKGVANVASDDIKNTAIEMYGLVSEQEFLDYFGGLILDTSRKANSDMMGLLISLAVLFGLFNFIYFIIYYTRVKITNASLEEFKNEIDQIYAEVDSLNTNQKLILLNKYLLDYTNGLCIIRYDDIKLIYLEIHRRNFIKVASFVKVYLSKKEFFNIAALNSTIPTEDKQREIIMAIAEKAPRAMVGYSKENLDKLV